MVACWTKVRSATGPSSVAAVIISSTSLRHDGRKGSVTITMQSSVTAGVHSHATLSGVAVGWATMSCSMPSIPVNTSSSGGERSIRSMEITNQSLRRRAASRCRSAGGGAAYGWGWGARTCPRQR